MSYWKFRPGQQESKSLDAATTGNGKAFSLADYEKAQWLIVWSAGVTAGAVVVESAHDPAYGGTWHALTASPVGFVSNAAIGGVADFPPGGYVRARISTAVAGGNVTVYINGVQAEQ